MTKDFWEIIKEVNESLDEINEGKVRYVVVTDPSPPGAAFIYIKKEINPPPKPT